jgi:hypothetical protein
VRSFAEAHGLLIGGVTAALLFLRFPRLFLTPWLVGVKAILRL